ncbi:hypothetical protein DI09_83p50 [Mitosporidium daphniae]|uniref:Chalcone isomerase domain-containing protein n=1 Tax=Mitosporidium daphniae TaxID=1485682 RepID=A0A098VM45_9MICR|nr:uncharacterized protein DI09_83p50 [Mitosporidium daphniae]KGG50172.1 hypothetical protein DI09_83p50 [Mitosporidium daphniae]|eukprot:XP_013236613.1 uncharacterized protein DI09_83p50 [Mitosporidium daphniae]
MFASFKFYVPLAGLSFAIGPLFYSKVSCDSDAANGKNTGLFYEKGTGMHVPTKLVLQNQYKLLSAAARKVTFLKFSVYSIGIYVTENDDAKSFNTCSDAVSKQSLALRLAPSRATTGTHMRAGLERALLQQLQLQLPKDTSEIVCFLMLMMLLRIGVGTQLQR